MSVDLFDLANGGFELGGGMVAWLNCVRVYQDKKILGVDWRVTWFFTIFGIWNMAYYPHLHQWCSVAGAVLLVVANAAWITLVVKYRRLARDALGGPIRRA